MKRYRNRRTLTVAEQREFTLKFVNRIKEDYPWSKVKEVKEAGPYLLMVNRVGNAFSSLHDAFATHQRNRVHRGQLLVTERFLDKIADPSTIKPKMNWNELITEVTAIGRAGSSAAPITGVEYDSRRVRPGAVFVAMKGGSTDGNRYVEKAIAAGALGIITDSAQTFDHLAGLSAGRAAAGGRARPPRACPGFGGILRPSRAQARRHRHHRHQRQNHHRIPHRIAAQRRCAHTVLIGTIEYHVAGEVRPSIHTTPESRDLFELMAEGVSARRHRAGHRSFKPRARPGRA